MGSDGALDAQGVFMKIFDVQGPTEEGLYFFERPENEIRDGLLSLTVDDLKSMSKEPLVKENKFVIPYTYLEYQAYPSDMKVREFLLDCLNYHKDLEEYGNGEELNHIKFFKDNFNDIISGRKELEGDRGLFATIADSIANGKTGLVNLTSDDE